MPGMPPEATRRSGWAFYGWFFQRLTALALFPLLFLHMIVNHYLDPETTIQAFHIEENLSKVSYIAVDSVLLVFTLFHGCNGVRNVAFDYVNDDQQRKLITYGLAFLGLVFTAFGFFVLFSLAGWI